MKSNFPQIIQELPEVTIPYDGVKAYVVQGEHQQVICMEFEKDVHIPEHSHESQWEIVLEGTVDYQESGIHHTYKKGDRFFVPKGKKHSADVHAGYCSIIFFNQKDRYMKK